MAMIKILNQINHINHIIINGSDNFAGSNGYLYLCGYLKSSYTSLIKKTIIFYYPTPNTTIVLDPNNVRLSDQTSTYNEATKLVVNGSNVFVSGSYDYTGFMITDGFSFSQPITLYGTTNHFVFKTNASLSVTSGWLTGAMANTTGTSRGNTLAYDATNSVYYLGGTFNNQVVLNQSIGQQWMNSFAGYDAFIGRFVDNGLAEFKRLPFFNDTTSKNANSNVIVYPNPAYDNVFISSLNQENISGFSITDLTGRRIINNANYLPSNEIKVDISTLAVGTYFVNIVTTNNIYKLKFVKVK
ncbi:MAG: hypothetical protein A2X08_00050 [Bacteroidetes bacterium GWA2_32_17]|nr:MAG: hypothetical protein A2X08_00050 [Bacteroidetes bacterium GWA2_32_17]